MSIDIDYENPWIYCNRPFSSDDIDDFYGFVYNITNLTNKRQYIGRKYFWSHRKPPGKKRRVKKESDWKKYSLHKTPGKTNFEETKQLFINGVLTESLDTGVPAYYNSNILSRYFRKDYYDGNGQDC